jgi:phage terminase Nu1 subunit (DNA packaging protein)
VNTEIEPGEAGDRMLRTSDLAHLFGVDVTTIRRWCTSIGLPSERLRSGQRRYRLSAVRAWYRAGLEGASK